MYGKECRGVWAEVDTLGGFENDLISFEGPPTISTYDAHQSQISYLLCPSLCSMSMIRQVLGCILKMLTESKSKSTCRIIWLRMIPDGKPRLPWGCPSAL